MKVLILSFYYEPDLCAGSFRCTSLVKQLLREKGLEVEVITTLPNRYATYSADAPKHEKDGNLEIHRVALPNHKSGMLDQVKAFYYFYREALLISKNKEYALVVATSSRLFTAFLGAKISKDKQVPLYLDIRDIFLDTLKDVLPKKLSFVLMPFLELFERYTFNRAAKVNLVSRGFVDYFNKRYPGLTYDFYTNGIDQEFIQAVCEGVAFEQKKVDVKTILYAGNIGEGQGLHKVVPELAKKLGDSFRIQILGDGGRKQQLIDALKVRGIHNVDLIPPVPRKELIDYYNQADILFLHLNNYEAFKKVLPSKIFEYAAFNKPVLAGVSGYAAEFIEENVTNSGVFPPCDVNRAVECIGHFSYENESREVFIGNYSRESIMIEMSKSIVSLLPK